MTQDYLDIPGIVRTVSELAPAGALPAPYQAKRLIDDLRDSAQRAEDLVFSVMDLPAEAEAQARTNMASTRIVVVDRLGWSESNARTFSQLFEQFTPPPETTSALGRLASRVPGAQRASDILVRRTASAEVGAMLAFLSGRVLGQFDPLGNNPQLMLVAPNVYRIERALEVNLKDFRLWVALHEQTHRTQFAVAPWLRDHLRGLLGSFVQGSDSDYRRVRSLLRRLPEAVRTSTSLVDVLADPTQRAVLDQVTAVMSLLEGHADVVMDAVGPSVIPTVDAIRASFNARRSEATGWRGTMSNLMGITDKLRQYERGASFVRAIVRARGHAGLARVWESPETLPRLPEIEAPHLWLERVPHTPPAVSVDAAAAKAPAVSEDAAQSPQIP